MKNCTLAYFIILITLFRWVLYLRRRKGELFCYTCLWSRSLTRTVFLIDELNQGLSFGRIVMVLTGIYICANLIKLFVNLIDISSMFSLESKKPSQSNRRTSELRFIKSACWYNHTSRWYLVCKLYGIHKEAEVASWSLIFLSICVTSENDISHSLNLYFFMGRKFGNIVKILIIWKKYNYDFVNYDWN
jgi:hypothetical protein